MKALARLSVSSVPAVSRTLPAFRYSSSFAPTAVPALQRKTLRPGRPAQQMGQTLTRAMSGDATAMINAKNQENPVMVYSKTYCPYCSEVKSLFGRLNVPAKVVELDNLADGDAIQAGLQTITGRRTVPQVFIAGKHVGGCDDTMEAYNNGKLKEMLAEAGVAI